MAGERGAQQYAQAIFEQATAAWLEPLKMIAASIAQSGLTDQLDKAGLAFSRKEQLLRAALPPDLPRPVQNFVFLLASKNETHLLPQIIAAFDQYAQRGPAGAVVKVTSAVPLTNAEKSSLQKKMRTQFGDDVAFEYAVDATILGGVVVRMGDKVIDGSVAGKLAALKEQLAG